MDGGSNNRIVDVTASANANGVTVAGREVGTGNEDLSSTVADNDRIGVAIINTVGVTVDGNTITGNGTEGVFMFGADEVTVTDNLISGNAFHGIEFQSESNFRVRPRSGDPRRRRLRQHDHRQRRARRQGRRRRPVHDHAEP